MSMTGKVVFTSNLSRCSAVDAIQQALAIASYPEVRSYSRYPPGGELGSPDAFPDLSELGEKTFSLWDAPAEDVLRHIQKNGADCLLMLWLGKNALADSIADAFEERFSTELRGDFVPFDMYVISGRHRHVEHITGLDLGRSLFSIEFFGYGWPTEWDLLREEFMKDKFFQRKREEISEWLGDAAMCIYWS